MIKLLGFLLGSPSCLFPRFLPPPSGVFPRCLPHSPRYVVDLQNSAFCGYPPSGWGGFFVLTHACATPNRTATRARTLVQAGITAKGSHRTASRLDVTRLQHTLASRWSMGCMAQAAPGPAPGRRRMRVVFPSRGVSWAGSTTALSLGPPGPASGPLSNRTAALTLRR